MFTVYFNGVLFVINSIMLIETKEPLLIPLVIFSAIATAVSIIAAKSTEEEGQDE